MVETTEERENFPMTKEDSGYPVLKMCTYNIISGGNAWLEAAMGMMWHMHMDLGILMEMELVEGFYTTKCEGYKIVATKAKNHHQGGVLLFYKTCTQWQIEGTKTYGPNVILVELVSGNKRWMIIIGAYIPPSENDGTTLGWLQKATAVATTHPLILSRTDRPESSLHPMDRLEGLDMVIKKARQTSRQECMRLHSGPRTITLPKLQDQITTIRE
jgi:hypothetical protein